MKKARTTVFLWLAIAGAAYSQQVLVQFDPPTLVPASLFPCNSNESTQTQTATFGWTLYCVSAGDFTSIRSGTVTGTGTGTCPGGTDVHFCGGAPGFTPKFQVGANVSIYVAVYSVNGTTALGACKAPSYTQGPINTVPTPKCFCDCTGNTKCCSAACIPNTQTCTTPIVLDAFDEGYHLTSLSNGVQFRLLSSGPLQQISWTDANWHNGWLSLDRNGDGTIDDFTELFGNYTAQPPTDDPNGFLALAVFDDPANGGNGNGVIDPGDSVYANLRVWIDANHNGYSEPNELHTLQELGIFKIGLTYRDTPFVDRYGNRFGFRGSMWDQGGTEHHACYDVFLVTQAN